MNMVKAISSADFRRTQFCYSCSKECDIFQPKMESQLEVAGLPCTDQSRAGKQAFEEGVTAPVFIAHAKLHINRRTPLVVLENVPDSVKNNCGELGWEASSTEA